MLTYNCCWLTSNISLFFKHILYVAFIARTLLVGCWQVHWTCSKNTVSAVSKDQQVQVYLKNDSCKGKGLDTCYRATCMSQTRDQQHFTISEVQLIGMSQWYRSALCGHPLPVLTDSWTHGAASRHTIAPISHTRPSPRSRSYYSFPVPLRVEG